MGFPSEEAELRFRESSGQTLQLTQARVGDAGMQLAKDARDTLGRGREKYFGSGYCYKNGVNHVSFSYARAWDRACGLMPAGASTPHLIVPRLTVSGRVLHGLPQGAEDNPSPTGVSDPV